MDLPRDVYAKTCDTLKLAIYEYLLRNTIN